MSWHNILKESIDLSNVFDSAMPNLYDKINYIHPDMKNLVYTYSDKFLKEYNNYIDDNNLDTPVNVILSEIILLCLDKVKEVDLNTQDEGFSNPELIHIIRKSISDITINNMITKLKSFLFEEFIDEGIINVIENNRMFLKILLFGVLIAVTDITMASVKKSAWEDILHKKSKARRRRSAKRYKKKQRRRLTSKPSSESSLKDWFGRKGAKGSKGGWVDCNAPDGSGGYKSCGRSSGEKRKRYPACRPTPSACKTKGKGKKWGKTK